MSNIEAIKTYFGADSRPVENREIMALSKEERQELGDACRGALGAEPDAAVAGA